MKKFKLLLLSLVAIVTLSSCNNKESASIWNALGTITSVSPLFTVQDDAGTIIRMATPTGLKLEDEGRRVNVFFTRTGSESEDSKVIEGTFAGLEFIYTVKLSHFDTDTLNTPAVIDSIGAQYIKPLQAWFGGDHLNMSYQAGLYSTTDKMAVSLVYDDEKSTNSDVYVSLYFIAEDFDPKQTNFSNFHSGFLNFTFKGSMIHIPGYGIVTFHISYIDPASGREEVFVIKSDQYTPLSPK